MVDRSEAYVGIFAWRYGYVPQPPATDNVPDVDKAVKGETSITEYEYRRAVERKLPVMAFLLDEHYPWPPQFVDGFDSTRTDAPESADKIRTLRQQLQQERVISWFTTPTDLEARVSAAVTMTGLTRQLDLQPATELPPGTGVAGDTSAEYGIRQAIIEAGDHQHALKIDLETTWWSTRLYLIAALAHRLTQARRILVVHTMPVDSGSQQDEEHFIGQLSTQSVLSTIGPKVPALRKFGRWLQRRPIEYSEFDAEIDALLDGWRAAFDGSPGAYDNERTAKVYLSAELLRRWFGDAMLQQPIHIADLQRASAVDLLRLLDYPNDYVPVVTRHDPAAEGQAATERVDVVDKGALNARLARSYLVELLDRERIA